VISTSLEGIGLSIADPVKREELLVVAWLGDGVRCRCDDDDDDADDG
jgi:hypothetical protein